jgi:CheY-like chemotaxis protein
MRCDNCGDEYDDSFKFCPYCGKREVEKDKTAAVPEAGPKSEPKPGPAPQKDKLVMIVDDDEVIVRLLSTQLKLNGYKTIAALDGEQAVRIAHQKTPDLILLDIAMPGLHGFAVIDKLRQSVHTLDIPIMIVSAFNDPDALHKAELYGIQEYVVKPFEVDDLIKKVDDILNA